MWVSRMRHPATVSNWLTGKVSSGASSSTLPLQTKKCHHMTLRSPCRGLHKHVIPCGWAYLMH